MAQRQVLAAGAERSQTGGAKMAAHGSAGAPRQSKRKPKQQQQQQGEPEDVDERAKCSSSAASSAGSAKPSYKHIPHSQKPAHLVAKRNARERRRVQAVNQAFYRLRRCVPIENRNKRVSKVKTLQRAIDYIRKLERVLADDGAGQLESPGAPDHTKQLAAASAERPAGRRGEPPAQASAARADTQRRRAASRKSADQQPAGGPAGWPPPGEQLSTIAATSSPAGCAQSAHGPRSPPPAGAFHGQAAYGAYAPYAPLVEPAPAGYFQQQHYAEPAPSYRPAACQPDCAGQFGAECAPPCWPAHAQLADLSSSGSSRSALDSSSTSCHSSASRRSTGAALADPSTTAPPAKHAQHRQAAERAKAGPCGQPQFVALRQQQQQQQQQVNSGYATAYQCGQLSGEQHQPQQLVGGYATNNAAHQQQQQHFYPHHHHHHHHLQHHYQAYETAANQQHATNLHASSSPIEHHSSATPSSACEQFAPLAAHELHLSEYASGLRGL